MEPQPTQRQVDQMRAAHEPQPVWSGPNLVSNNRGPCWATGHLTDPMLEEAGRQPWMRDKAQRVIMVFSDPDCDVGT